MIKEGVSKMLHVFREGVKVQYTYNQIKNSKINLQVEPDRSIHRAIINFIPSDTIN